MLCLNKLFYNSFLGTKFMLLKYSLTDKFHKKKLKYTEKHK